MMIGGEFNTPADWLRAGNAINTIDDFAAAHGGNAPVFVFVDSGGAFNNDTECVNGTRGNAADHLTKDVVPFMMSNFGVSADRANWGVVGWSMGGTCAVDLTVMHPDLFSAFVDIAGDLSPEFGHQGADHRTASSAANAAAWAAFDPTTVIANHGPYTRVSGWFAINGTRRQYRSTAVSVSNSGLGGRDGAGNPDDQTRRRTRCARRAAANGIDCAVVVATGQARLAVRRARVRRGAAVAGGATPHSWCARDPAACLDADGAAGSATARAATLQAESAGGGQVSLKLLGGGQRILNRIVIARRRE